MTNIILIDKTGTIKQATVKGLAKDLSNLYKKCGCKNPDEFDKCGSWNVNIDTENVYVEMWARDNGRANMENKYDFPPPVDNELYYGNCALVAYNENDEKINLTKSVWEKIYEKLNASFSRTDIIINFDLFYKAYKDGLFDDNTIEYQIKKMKEMLKE